MGDANFATSQSAGFEWVEEYLDLWVRNMRDPDLRLEAPTKASGFIAGGNGGYREPAAEWEAEANGRAVDVINAALSDMSPAEVCAVQHIKLFAVYRFREPVEAIYANARMKIGVRLTAADFG